MRNGRVTFLGVAVIAAHLGGLTSCSSSGGEGNETGGAAGAGVGGSAAGTGGAGGSTGGTGGSTGGSSGTSAGTSGTGGASGSAGGAQCTASVTDGQACTADCLKNPCGIHKVGMRDCTCAAAVYDCATCTYEGAPGQLVDPPTSPLPQCDQPDTQMEDRTDCGTAQPNGYRCTSQGNARRMCACWNGLWDCGSVPSNWP